MFISDKVWYLSTHCNKHIHTYVNIHLHALSLSLCVCARARVCLCSCLCVCVCGFGVLKSTQMFKLERAVYVKKLCSNSDFRITDSERERDREKESARE